MTSPHVVAIHEAAHCVALAYFGWRIRAATIIPDGRHDGLVEHDPTPPDAEALEDYVISAAGYEAERKLAGGQDPDWHSSVEDFAVARRRLETAIPDVSTRLATMKRGTLLARHVVVTHWPLIETLAARLERDRRLSGAQVLGIVQAHAEATR